MKLETEKAWVRRRITELEAEAARLRRRIARLRLILRCTEEPPIVTGVVDFIAETQRQLDLLQKVGERKSSSSLH
jgi:hypothetical protein